MNLLPRIENELLEAKKTFLDWLDNRTGGKYNFSGTKKAGANCESCPFAKPEVTEPESVDILAESRKKFDQQTYLTNQADYHDNRDCSAAVRSVYPEFEGLGSSGIKTYLTNNEKWTPINSFSNAKYGDVLTMDGHVEIVTGVGVDHNEKPALLTWGCRTTDSQNLNPGCGDGVFSEKYLKKNNTVVFSKAK